jgi:hypothetical protein
MEPQDHLTVLLRFLDEKNYSKYTPIPSDDLDDRLRELGVNPSVTQKALTRGYVASEPWHNNFTLNGRHFHWMWLTEQGAARLAHGAPIVPVKDSLCVDEIESFWRVCDVKPAVVASFLKSGYLDIAEDIVQTALEAIVEVAFHKKDWGGENNDLYTANVIVDGKRRPTAFLLKGNGLKSPRMDIKHCGKNGDQIVRLFWSPADLFVIQFVGNIAEPVIHHAHSELMRVRAHTPHAQLLIVDGQDTARLLHAYGKLAHPPALKRADRRT